MHPEALDALANETMRPKALDAAMEEKPRRDTLHPADEQNHGTSGQNLDGVVETPAQPSTPFGQRTDGTASAAKVVEDMAHGVKAAIDGVVSWAEKKADELSAAGDSTGPYTSPATCAPTDLDPIACGVLPAMPTEKQNGKQNLSEGEKSKQETIPKDCS